MNQVSKKLFWGISSICLWGVLAEGAVEGTFKYYGYDIEFHNGIMDSLGETKSILSESIDITTTASNTFTAVMGDWTLSRSITNHPVGGFPDIRLYNAYVVERSPESGSISGITTINSDLLLQVIPDGDNPVPFYFNTTTNVALSLSDSGQSLGAGLLIRKSSGMNAASLNGTYIRYTLGNTFQDPEMYGWGYVDKLSLETYAMTFDGAGNYTETGTNREFSRRTNERGVIDPNMNWQFVIDTYFTLTNLITESTADGSTYSVQSDGTLLISTGVGSIANQISPDGNLIASSMCLDQGSDSAGTYMTVAVKQPQNMPTNAVEAVYFMVEFGEYFSDNSPDAGIHNNKIETTRTYIYLHSDSTFSLRSDFWGVENKMDNAHFMIDGDPVSANLFSTTAAARSVELTGGTYAIAPNGIVSLMFRDGQLEQGQLSANGEYLVAGNSETGLYYAGHMLDFGVRRPSPPPPPGNGAVTFSRPAATPSGIDISIAVPADYPVEILNTADLTAGEWNSSGVFTSGTGTLQFHDPDATNAARRFYSATFAPW